MSDALSNGDTIVACATPTGYSGIAVIRISGEKALSLVKAVFVPIKETPEFESNRAYYGKIIQPGQMEIIDWAIATFFFAPHSYTGEDAVELSCHGNPLIVDTIIKIFVGLGARIAGHGEFTKRALLHGKIDLLQAEAVFDTIYASCAEARKLAIAQYEGKLSENLYRWRARLIDLLTSIEANIDFPEEEDIKYDNQTLTNKTNEIIAEIDELLRSAEQGIKIKEGYRVTIIGRNNVGKSTLFNKLLGFDRAIVHGTPGTTRDYLEEGVEIQGLYLRLIDTAGFLQNAFGIDKLSTDRSEALIGQSDLILLVFDGAEPLNEQDIHLYNLIKNRKKILIINKIDLNVRLKESEILSDSIKISAKTGDNIDLLRNSIRNLLKPNLNNKNILITRHRHIQALKEIKNCLSNIQKTGMIETIAFELHSALDTIGELTGKVLRKEILDRIFEEFCIGK